MFRSLWKILNVLENAHNHSSSFLVEKKEMMKIERIVKNDLQW